MRISELFYPNKIINLKEDRVVKGITSFSRKVKPGYVFVAIKGKTFDGHMFIKEAEKNGAIAFVTEHHIDTEKPYVVVEKAREYMGVIAKKFYSPFIEGLKIIGITGTNGKTTTAFFAQKILNEAGIPTANFGTVIYDTLKKKYTASRTTPESADIYEFLKESKENGAQAVVMEVSSAGLKEKRVDTLKFYAGVFTNFSREHLEYHTDMEDYFNSKKKLFTELTPEYGIFNIDCKTSFKILKDYRGTPITFGLKGGDLHGEILKDSLMELVIRVKGKMEGIYTIPVGLRFNAYNFLAALSVAYVMGIKPNKIHTEKIKAPPGRMEYVKNSKGYLIFVDYAHTKEAIEKLLASVKPYVRGRLIIVFGAGGDRDPGKRPLMGKAATKYADISIITSDNPRSEDPEKIIDDILKGVTSGNRYIVEPDRKKAIEIGISLMKKEDVLIIAGKGHETYQEIKGKKYPFDDRKIVKEILEEL